MTYGENMHQYILVKTRILKARLIRQHDLWAMNLHKLSAKVLITEHSQANKWEVQDEFESFTKIKN